VKRKRRIGIGDITLIGALSCNNECWCLRSVYGGVAVILPSGGRPDQRIIWDALLGNGGSFFITPFVSALWHTRNDWLNPFIRAIAEFSIPFTRSYRIPKLITQPLQRTSVRNVPELYTPELFRSGTGYFVDQFSEYDTLAMLFPDHAVPTHTRFGSRFVFTAGNYVDNLFACNVRLGIIYEYTLKGRDHLSVKECYGVFDTQFARSRTRERAHMLGWNGRYRYNDCLDIQIGSEHIVAGLNVSRQQTFYITVSFDQ
jgi:hypothetical protein